MQIAGLQKLSLVDYPGKLACIIFTQGCNFRCGFCHNPELVSTSHNKAKEKAEESFFKFLKEREDFIDGVCITGGEPLLQEDLENFIMHIKERGLLVKLDTNGFLSGKLENIIKKRLVDYIAMDIKTPPSPPLVRGGDKYSEAAGVDVNIEKIKQSIQNIMAGGIDYEFRTTVVDKLHTKEDILQIAEYIKGAKKYCLQKFEVRDKILSSGFLSAKSITKKEALELKAECEKFAEEVELRGWD